jgi:hypothetical protein
VNYYERVTRQKTCLICGKPDWCSYTPNGKISFCARTNHNADRVSRTGWECIITRNLFLETCRFPVCQNRFQKNLSRLPSKSEIPPIESSCSFHQRLIQKRLLTVRWDLINVSSLISGIMEICL